MPFDPEAFIVEKATELNAFVDAHRDEWLKDINWLERNAARAGLRLAERYIEPMVVRVVQGLAKKFMTMSVAEIIEASAKTVAHADNRLAQMEPPGDVS